jgi:glycosyltransferase involved in cell wall biosynthesis
MRIAVDARELAGHPTGVGRYLSELLHEWSASERAQHHDWLLYAPEPLAVVSGSRFTVRVVPGHAGTVWEQWALPRALAADRPDLLFAPGYSAPLRQRCPTVQTIHDVSFAAHPEWFTFREGARRRQITRLSARKARTILTDTAFSRDEIVRHLGVPREQVVVVPLGIRPLAAAPDTRVAREPLVLFVGSIFARRHVDALITGFAKHVAPEVPGSRLAIVGENRSHPRVDLERILAELPESVRSRIAVRSYVDQETLSGLYARASVFVFPSEYEGFGFTPLEALSAGVPAVVLDTPVAREVYGDAVRYVPLTRHLDDGLGRAVLELLSSDTARGTLLASAREVVSRYDWKHTAARTLDALEEAARG